MRNVSFLLVVVMIAPILSAAHRFHASATAISRNGDVTSLLLPAEGGTRTSSIVNYDDGMVRFDRAVMNVSGTEDRDAAHTTVTLTFTNLSIAGRIHADEVEARLVEIHRPDAAEAEITFDGSTVRNLTIDGRAMDVTIDLEPFSKRPTFSAMKDYVRQYYGLSRNDDVSGWIRDSLVMTGGKHQPATASDGIDIPGLGTLYLGDVEMKFGERHLTMFRLALTRPLASRGLRVRSEENADSLSVGSVEGNGTYTVP